MGQILHASATMTGVVRRAIQRSSDSPRALAKRYGINPKTVAKWKKRTIVADLPTGPRTPRSTALSVEDEAVIPRFAATRCCRWTIACTRCSRPSRIHWLTGYRAAMSREAEPLGPASLLAAARHLAPARSWRRQARQEALQTVSHRVFSHRSGRGPNGRGQVESLRRH